MGNYLFQTSLFVAPLWGSINVSLEKKIFKTELWNSWEICLNDETKISNLLDLHWKISVISSVFLRKHLYKFFLSVD